MTENTKNHKSKALITVLAILLGISLLSLAGILLYNHFADDEPSLVTVPNNIITPDDSNSGSTTAAGTAPPVTADTTGSVTSGDTTATTTETTTATTTKATTTAAQTTTTPVTTGPGDTKQAAAIYLHKKSTQDNEPFNVENMFPGDREFRYFCVKVSYHDDITVHFKSTIRQGYEKLGEVMKVKVVLLGANKVLYDGLMKDMPDSVTHKLSSPDSTTDELYYEITAYLDGSVGNAYMEKSLVADFKWCVEEIENTDNPQTGVNSNIPLLLAGASLLFMLMIHLVYKMKDEGERNAKYQN